MRLLLLPLVTLALTVPAGAIEPYVPLPLKAPVVVSPPDDLLVAAAALMAAVKAADVEGIGKFLAPRIRAVDGALDLHVKRRTEVLGPHRNASVMLSDLANYIGGDVEPPPPGGDALPNRLRAEQQYIEVALEDDVTWGADPMVKGAICTYAYRSYDVAAIKALSEATGVASSSFVYVDKPYTLHTEPDTASAAKGVLETDRLYALDYDTPSPGHWIGVYLPDGSTGFADFDVIDLQKPYAAGICFAKAKNGQWQIVGQTSTSL
ncbi:MAG TPA: hypothetical protein PK286_07500 [Devosia sp.]|nr:hypothetical protein [Devosia sp.]